MGEKGKYMGKNILVAYSSKTGNTKKLAEGILDGIKKMEGGVVDTADIVDIKDIKDISEIDKYDTVIAGYWVDKGGANEEAAVFLKKITGKKVGIFATLACWPDSEHGYNCVTAGENLVKENNHVIGKFVCQGKLDEKIEAMFDKLPEGNPHRTTPEKKKRYKISRNHPSAADIASAAEMFCERIEADV